KFSEKNIHFFNVKFFLTSLFGFRFMVNFNLIFLLNYSNSKLFAMSNIHHNRVKTTISPEDMDEIRAAFQTLNDKLPFLVGISPTERRALPKMRMQNKVFTEDAIRAMKASPELLPGYISLEDLQMDMTLLIQLNQILGMSRSLVEKLLDTQILVGSEAYSTALLVYDIYKTSYKAGLPGAAAAYEEFYERFKLNIHG